jgi:hypothetical protein
MPLRAKTTPIREESEPSDELLLQWCGRHSDHRDALARFFATWVIQKKRLEPVVIDDDRIVNHLVTHVLKVLSTTA